MHKKLVLFFAVFLLNISAVFAQTRSLAVYPFSSQDVLLGFAVADRLATAFEGELETLGPAVTPAFIPPLVAPGGFLSPLAFFGNLETSNIADRNGTALLRDALGIDAALTGQIQFVGEQLQFEGYLATAAGVSRFRLLAPEQDPGLLAQKVIALMASRLELSRPQAITEIDLSGAYGDYVSALALLSGGFVEDAINQLELALAAQENPRWQELLADLKAVQAAEMGQNAAVMAVAALSSATLDTQGAIRYFEQFAEQSALPVAQTWLATLKADVNDVAGAQKAFDMAADYPYGLAARASYRAVNELEGANADIVALQDSDAFGAVLGAALAARQLDDLDLEKELLGRLSRLAPDFSYSFERLSMIAFEQEEPLAAAQALVVATELEPESDLYWTNLGWAYYLLGFLDKSEAASVRATQLDNNQFIAWYNLGLVQVVTGRLDEGMGAYEQALIRDPEVDDGAVADLENALELYPAAAGVKFALATLYEAEGRRDEAATQFERYLEQGNDPHYLSHAEQRLQVLRAPPPPIEISPGASLGLGIDHVSAEPYHPGDRLYPLFELYTPGFELPSEVEVELRIRDAEAQDLDLSASTELRIPSNAVALMIKDVGLDLPRGLKPGRYELLISVTADAERQATASLSFEVAGEPLLLRQLFSRNIDLRSLDTAEPLYSSLDISRADGDLLVLDALINELRQTADVAEEALPVADSGRFEGLSGGEIFMQSTEADVRDFLLFLLEQSGVADADFTFVDAYAQWALDGAPESGGE